MISTHIPARVGQLCVSVGSIGHPDTCALACKYHNKAAGCKDGQLCVRCHLCTWQRKQRKITNAARWTLDIKRLVPDETHQEGISTPDPPPVCNHLLNSDESFEGHPAEAETPREVGKGVRPLEIEGELCNKLYSWQMQQQVGLGM